jgi:hypothetical protein
MFPANAFTIRLAGDEHAAALRGLAELDSQPELTGRVLIAIEDEVPIAALSIDEGSTVADPFRRTSLALTLLRMRANALTSHEQTPSLRDRIRAGTRVARGPLAHAAA